MSHSLSDYLQQNRDRFEKELGEFLAIPSVSTESRHSKDVERCADWVAEHIRRSGVSSVEIVETEGKPIVVAEHIVNPDLPTLLVYGHYDVQPVDPVELWESPPFEATVRDGCVFARGSNDDKGQVHMHIKALEARLKTGLGMPVNVKLVIEGEEEIGSVHLEAFLRDNAQRLACDAVVISDTGMLGPDIPSIGTGLRGLAYLEVFVDGPAGDLHSGSYGGAVVNPALALAGMLTALKDENGTVTIPGFYDRVRPITDEEREALDALPFDDGRRVSCRNRRGVAGRRNRVFDSRTPVVQAGAGCERDDIRLHRRGRQDGPSGSCPGESLHATGSRPGPERSRRAVQPTYP